MEVEQISVFRVKRVDITMKRNVLKLVLALGVVLDVSGCAGKEKNEMVGVDGYSEHIIEFPSGNDEKTEYNQEALSIDAFTLEVALPDGWSVSDQANDAYGLMSCFSRNYIYDKSGECVGAVGYNVVPSDLDEDSLIPIAIYSQIALGNDYCFDVKENYDVISSSDKVETALTDVYYSPVITGGSEEKKNKGIVSYDLTHGVYVAIEFEDDALSDDAYSYIANSLSLDCSTDDESERKDQTEAYAVAQYGNVEVTIYREESDRSDPYIYRAEFMADGVACNLSIHSDDPKELDAYLNTFLGEPENSRTPILSDVLGFNVRRVEMEETSPFQVMWHYYVEVNGEDICVAEQFGYENYPESWSRDLDGDGVPELICNNQYGDGVQEVCVYRNNNGSIEKGSIRWSYYSEKFGWINLGEGGISGLPAERYDPERDIFTAAHYDNDSDTTVTAEFDDGLIPFEFIPFTHSS